MEEINNYAGISEIGDTTWSNKTENDEENKTTVFQSQKNPLELTPVIKYVLQYMNVKDLKNCRYISKEWSSAGLSELKRRSKIVFKRVYNRENGSVRNMNPALFYKDFSKTSLSTPFTAFGYTGTFGFKSFEKTELNSFVESHKNILHEFYVEELRLVDEDGQNIDSFDITPYIINSPMTMPNTIRSTKLSVCQNNVDCSKIVVPLSTVMHVKKLALEECEIVVQDKIKIRPIELKLKDVKFVKDEEKLSHFCVNDAFDFSKSKEIEIDSYFIECEEEDEDDIHSRLYLDEVTLLHVDMSTNNSVVLDYLNLSNIKVINWGSCKWTVKKLKLFNIPFIEITDIQFKDLFFWGSVYSKIDISVLPDSVEKLALLVIKKDDCFSSQFVIFPNLKYLYLNVKNHLSEVFSHFVNSPLVELHLGDLFLSREINFDSIPKSVKKLKLNAVKVKLQEGDIPLNLDVLILEDYSFTCHAKMLRILTSSHFKTKELVIVNRGRRFQAVSGTIYMIRSSGIQPNVGFLRFLKFHKKCLDCNQRFYIGPFEWDSESDSDSNSTFEKSNLFKYVDREAGFYVFENGMGKAVDGNDFVKLETVGSFVPPIVKRKNR